MTTTTTPAPTIHARLSDEQVQDYRREGYLVVTDPIFPQAKFDKLKNYFEGLLDNLDSSQRPEAMDVPHFTHPELFE
jgi:hypothetical protein